ncbi:hypothetical protein HOY82DRAFT_543002 [Tuber indicum]|nr:hypothetical protein HOY82DRAFT_543002 [Tuber indicum]
MTALKCPMDGRSVLKIDTILAGFGLMANLESSAESFISAQHRGFSQAWTALGRPASPGTDLIDSFFTDSDEESTSPNPSGLVSQIPDAIAIVEKGIKAGVLNYPANRLDTIDYHSEEEEQQPVPIPLIGLETAVHYTGELARFLQALEVTSLPFPQHLGKRNTKVPVDQLISSMQDLNLALLSFQKHRSTRQTTLTQFFKPYQPELLGKDGKEGKGGRAFIDLEVEPRYNWISSEEDDGGQEEPDQSTFVSTRWTTRNVNTAYEQLLR